MRHRGALSFAAWSGASVLVAALALLPLAVLRGTTAVQWGLFGWLVTAVAGVGGGVWLVSRHGRPGTGFVLALVVCMLARLTVFVGGPLAVAPLGAEAVGAFLIGLFAGYVPAQAAEMTWFARSTGAMVAEGR